MHGQKQDLRVITERNYNNGDISEKIIRQIVVVIVYNFQSFSFFFKVKHLFFVANISADT